MDAQKRERFVSDNPDQKTFYSDLAEIRISSEEMVFHFGLRNEDEPEKATGVAKVYVSVPHAKRIAETLVNGLKKYEELFGEIITDPGDRLINKDEIEADDE